MSVSCWSLVVSKKASAGHLCSGGEEKTGQSVLHIQSVPSPRAQHQRGRDPRGGDVVQEHQDQTLLQVRGVLKYFLSAGSQPPARGGEQRILTPEPLVVFSLSSRSTEPEEAEAILETEQRLEKIRQSLQQKESQELEQLRHRQAEAEQELEELKRRREERRRVREEEERRREEEEQQRLAKEEVPD